MSKLRFSRVFTYLGAIFLMSHIIFNNSASAITPIIDITSYGVVYGLREVAVTCDYSDNTHASAYYCTGSNSKRVLGVSPNIGTVNFKKGDVIDFYMTVASQGFTDSFSNAGLGNVQTSSLYFQILNVEQVTDSSIPSFYYDNVQYLSAGSTVSYTYHITLSVVDDYSGNFAVQGSSRIPLLSLWGYSSNDTYVVFLSNFVVMRNNGGSSADQQNEINATNDAVDDSETSGDQASTDANSATSSLLSVIGGFVNVITSASPSNCVIDAPLNTAFSNDRFNVDLCALDLPAGIGALTSIIAIMIIVPFCISMFNKFIGIISGFQK